MSQLVLSLFPGIGLLDMAFEEEGFTVVRGPDLLWGGDIKRFHPPAGRFDGVIGGPPCQLFSQMRHIQPLAGQKHGNLIPEFERVVAAAAPTWFVMENVRDAPIPAVPGYSIHAQLVKDCWVGGDTMRVRRFSFGTPDGLRLGIEQLALHTPEPEVAALAGGGDRSVPVAIGGSGKVKATKQYGNSGPRTALGRGGSSVDGFAFKLRQQGLPADFLRDAPFTASEKSHAVGNGVPLPMGRAVARAVKRALDIVAKNPDETATGLPRGDFLQESSLPNSAQHQHLREASGRSRTDDRVSLESHVPALSADGTGLLPFQPPQNSPKDPPKTTPLGATELPPFHVSQAAS